MQQACGDSHESRERALLLGYSKCNFNHCGKRALVSLQAFRFGESPKKDLLWKLFFQVRQQGMINKKFLSRSYSWQNFSSVAWELQVWASWWVGEGRRSTFYFHRLSACIYEWHDGTSVACETRKKQSWKLLNIKWNFPCERMDQTCFEQLWDAHAQFREKINLKIL